MARNHALISLLRSCQLVEFNHENVDKSQSKVGGRSRRPASAGFRIPKLRVMLSLKGNLLCPLLGVQTPLDPTVTPSRGDFKILRL